MTHLKRLDESPEQSSNSFASVEQLDEPHNTKQSKEVDFNDRRAVKLLHKNSRHGEWYNGDIKTVLTCFNFSHMCSYIIIMFRVYTKCLY